MWVWCGCGCGTEWVQLRMGEYVIDLRWGRWMTTHTMQKMLWASQQSSA